MLCCVVRQVHDSNAGGSSKGGLTTGEVGMVVFGRRLNQDLIGLTTEMPARLDSGEEP